jgi:transcriptional regulator with XRE-family HTH domain
MEPVEEEVNPFSTLYQVRMDRNLTVEQLAKRSGVAAHVIRRCEKHNSLPGDTELRALSQALQCKLGVLLGLLRMEPSYNQPLAKKEYRDIVGLDGRLISMKEFHELTLRVCRSFPQRRD